ncbi:lysophospholipase [Yamadazyma tenuis]|uniref:Lysophospholipase n=1 Tax=Candida tenuis (strain ATCC 10573 / BCRC 21748 / CBS 615 / JCM 9827 / NBRC 10315 / NRRL Y-1498 / VKM Y-70) TaxID=590646 RepID=G3AZ27_CANTC|nr:uncharacterized protein CANTEDRAFT_119016 [Yamadazyma tenuis ATCC 10573]EGV65988.1 hypothetical protein CANTEDRAFT_119016 [Yamadazyma tenuis ATCC 10573]WEJ95670.1 lysophospholipase [Yamadazyma tenuis]
MNMLVVALLLWCDVICAKSPTGTFAPGLVTCPNTTSLIREGDSLSNSEKSWIDQRKQKTRGALQEYLSKVGLDDSLDLFENSSADVNIAVSMSGGGYRAMLAGAGQLAALDNRTEDANEYGLGGVLQSANYLSSLSGGSWLVGSLVMQDFPTVEEVVLEDPYDVWNLTDTRQLLETSGLWTIAFSVLFDSFTGFVKHLNNYVVSASHKVGIKYDMQRKKDAGFPITITEPWARGLSYQLLQEGEDDYGTSTTFSDLRGMKTFQNYDMPFPLFTAIGRKPNTITYHLNSTVFEFNPFEMGSFDPSVNSFIDIKYLGTNVTNGEPTNGSCVAGFDNAGYVMGTSSSLFNSFLSSLTCPTCNSLNVVLKYFVNRFLDYLSDNQLDIAQYSPNPFKGSQYAGSDSITNNDTLYLMDGGLANETLAISSLLTTHRKIDAVVAMDNGDNWPNGRPLIAAYERQFESQGKSLVVPYVPNEETFLHNNLTAKPTFFGCDASNLTDLIKDDVVPPLVIYIANRPYSFFSNTSLFKLSYTDDEKKGMVRNGFETAARLNGTIDENWPKCVGCALIKREQERQGIEPSDECEECFQEYCWDGKRYEPEGVYYPPVNFTDSGLTNDSFALVGAGEGQTYTSDTEVFGL